jgi:hypothetical protein
MSLTRAEIRANREKWVAFLQEPERKKARHVLARGNNTEHRCCLGHACHVLDPERKTGWGVHDGLPPDEIVQMLGLWSEDGFIGSHELTYGKTKERRLAALNDGTRMRPQEIGKMLAGMIEGGVGTPFKPLTDYRE